MKTKDNIRIVVKIGSNVLTNTAGTPDLEHIGHLVDQLAWLRQQGAEVILVTSGAVAMGRAVLPQLDHLNKVMRRQVWASVGQARLMHFYQELFQPYHIHVAQLLVTKEDFRDREHYLNMKHCLQGLLRGDIIPVINENDAVAVTELMFTDNDELAGLVAATVNAGALVILSNVDGIFDGHPADPGSKLIPEIQPGNPQFQQYILPSISSFGRGGMQTKYRIAAKSALLGIDTYIANGKTPDILQMIWEKSGRFTRFPAQKQASNLKKRLAHQPAERRGVVHLNEGAAEVLRSPHRVSSLLPVGLTRIEGDFEPGDLISLQHEEQEIGIGVARYSAATARKYIGQKGGKPLVHYDYLLIW